MKTVGIRQLKSGLSAYIRAVRRGETVAVTDRGEVVAELVPPKKSKRDEHPFAEMARRGEITLGRPLSVAEKKKLYGTPRKPLLNGITSAELLDAVRGDR
ncbi:MAG TPA: type II toxin-antitoxin system prevent-host-death family antitoxin [Rhizomicrobium sp.]